MNRPKQRPDGLPENVRIRHGAYTIRWFDLTDTGERKSKEKKLCRVSDGRDALYKAIAEFYGEAKTPRVPDMPAMIDKFCKTYFPTLSPGVQREYQRQYARIAKAFVDFDVDVPQKKDCIEFLELNWLPGSRIMQAYKSRLMSFFRWAADRGYRTDNPALDIRLKEPVTDTRYPTHDEFYRIRDAMLIGENGRPTRSGEMMQCFMDLLYLTAQRPTEIRLLTWSQIKDGAIEFRPTKTLRSSGAAVRIPVTDAIQSVLDRARALGQVKGYYVIHQADGSPYGRYGVGSAWARARARAGVEGVTTRHMRPKATTDAVEQGYSVDALQTTLAHTTRGTTEGYVRKISVPVSAVKIDLPKRKK